MMRLDPPSPHLLFVPYEFPFGTGETFIESEIGPLARAFERCYVMPSRAFFSADWHAQAKPARALPDGCELVLPPAGGPAATWRIAATTIDLLRHARDHGEPGQTGQFLAEALRDAVKAAFFAREARRVLAANQRITLAYTYWKGPATLALAALKAEQPGLRVVTRCHGADLYYDLPEKPSRPFDHRIAASLDRVLPISEYGRTHLLAHGFDPARTQVSRLGITIPAQPCRPSSDGVWRIVSCSNVLPLKRVPLLAQALARLSRPYIWTHFGDGVDMPEVRELVKQLPTHGRAVLPGRVPNEQVLHHYRTEAVDLFVNVSTSEGMPVSILEALAASVPVLATDVGATAEVVDEAVGGLLPARLSHQDLHAALEALLSAETTLRSKRAAARRRAEERCDARLNYGAFTRLLHATSFQPSQGEAGGPP